MNASSFDPNAIAIPSSGIYGLPFSPEEASLVLLPVPWDVTTSYSGGTHQGPAIIEQASYQVDLYHPDAPDAWKDGIAMLPIDPYWIKQNAIYRKKARKIIQSLEKGNPPNTESLQQINAQSEALNQWVASQTDTWLHQNKCVGIVGGDHSTPLGFLRSLSKKYDSFGILHIDAHMDLRVAYEGFTYSHASIMHNALSLPHITTLVQVGIRDTCSQEWARVNASGDTIHVYTDAWIHTQLFEGMMFDKICAHILDKLPQHVYISVDIDGLDPSLCPHTGTPVPGGLSFTQWAYLMSKLARSGRKIIGFDLVEVAPGPPDNDWDANVGARALYHLFVCQMLSKHAS